MTEVSRTAERALSLLEMVAEAGSAKPAELAERLGLSRTVVQRLLVTLRRRGFVRKTEDGFVLGPALLKATEQVRSQLLEALAGEARTLADEIGDTVVGHIRESEEAVVVTQALGRAHIVRAEHVVGSRHPLTAGASGRAILAFLGPEAQEELVSGAADSRDLGRQLEEIRRVGYAVSYDELQRGVHGVAAPILDAEGVAVASLALLVPAQRGELPVEHVDRLIAAARGLSSSA